MKGGRLNGKDAMREEGRWKRDSRRTWRRKRKERGRDINSL